MPYKEKEKAKDASKERMRRYRERQGVTVTPVTPLLRPDVTPKAEVITQLRQLIKELPLPGREAIVPLYNASIHRAGDRVRVFDGNKLVEMVIPELDAEGQPIPQRPGSTQLNSSFNLMKPSLKPNPKPAKKVKKAFRRLT